jgi:hypothetical protein
MRVVFSYVCVWIDGRSALLFTSSRFGQQMLPLRRTGGNRDSFIHLRVRFAGHLGRPKYPTLSLFLPASKALPRHSAGTFVFLESNTLPLIPAQNFHVPRRHNRPLKHAATGKSEKLTAKSPAAERWHFIHFRSMTRPLFHSRAHPAAPPTFRTPTLQLNSTAL